MTIQEKNKERNEKLAQQIEEYKTLVEVLRIYNEEMSKESQELHKQEFEQLEWNRVLLYTTIIQSTEDLEYLYDEEYDNVVSFYTSEEQRLAVKTAKDLYGVDICTMDEPDLCCDELEETIIKIN